MPTDRENQFHRAMLDIYVRAKEQAGYNATRFLNMVNEHGGPDAARILLHAEAVSDGFTALWERQRLDLTVEALILKPQWHDLFTDEERQVARKRLADYGYVPE